MALVGHESAAMSARYTHVGKKPRAGKRFNGSETGLYLSQMLAAEFKLTKKA
jgi:hypothetical protein